MCGCNGNVTRTGDQVVTSNQLAARIAAAEAQQAAALSEQTSRDSLAAALVNSGTGDGTSAR
jgi:hypothetical protein